MKLCKEGVPRARRAAADLVAAGGQQSLWTGGAGTTEWLYLNTGLEWPDEASDWGGLGWLSSWALAWGQGRGWGYHGSVGVGRQARESIRTGQAWPQKESLLERWGSHEAAARTWEAGKAGQLPQAARAPWEQTRPSAGSPARCSITLHY